MDKIREMADANTIVGTPITTPDGTMLIPISKVSFGFATGGADFGGHEKETEKTNETITDRKSNFGGGAGAGVNITPIAFMVIPPDGNVRMMTIGEPVSTALDRVVDILPDLISRVQDFIAQMRNKKENPDA
ncbi:MAG: GerW family sporulation protein [Clostridiaceae bacterium]|nr:GerW family sporulation protein [Clostridiaceae bacterium]